MRGQIIFILLLPLLLLLTVSALSAQELKEMEFREVPNTIILDRDDRSLLRIESSIPNISFSSNKGVIPGTFKEIEPGVLQAQVYPGVQLISIRAEGYLPILNVRHNFPPRLTWWLKVTPKVIIPPEGRGNITIETNPPGASVAFNNIP
ncbi:hypothetical protein ISS30_07305, partial [bacterium]|nr:hypothetical protein [bacterium]